MRGIPAFITGGGRLPLKARLLLYFSVLILVLVICLLPMLYFFGIIPTPQKDITVALDTYLTSYEKNVSRQFSNVTAAGIQLSQELVQTIERTLHHRDATLRAVSDNPRLIGLLEQYATPRLKTALLQANASGAFMILDATVNSALPQAAHSRCGVYLKISNITSSNAINPTIFWLRGMSEVAEKYQFEFHNKWDLEFDISGMPSFYALMHAKGLPLPDSYFITDARYLPGTWEKVILICLPLRGRDGTVYGVCGLEISDLLFKLAHAHIVPPLPGMTGLLAPRHRDAPGSAMLDIDAGFRNGLAMVTYERAEPCIITPQKHYNRYTGKNLDFIGTERALRLAPLSLSGENVTWVVAALLPKEKEHALILKGYAVTAGFLALFLGIALSLSLFLVRRYAAPILKGVQSITAGGNTTTNVEEIDTLLEFLKNKEEELIKRQKTAPAVQPAMAEPSLPDSPQPDITAYRTFIEQISTLTKAERLVFDLYIKGFTSREIALKLNLSINTIRTHNRNIYGKLNVSSYKEMMVYVHMMTGNSDLSNTF